MLVSHGAFWLGATCILCLCILSAAKQAVVSLFYEDGENSEKSSVDKFERLLSSFIQSLRYSGHLGDVIILHSDSVAPSKLEWMISMGLTLRSISESAVTRSSTASSNNKNTKTISKKRLMKLHIWNLEEYDQIMYYDLDFFFLKNPQLAFADCGDSAPLCAVVDKTTQQLRGEEDNPKNSRFNTGFMVIHPNKTAFEAMVSQQYESSSGEIDKGKQLVESVLLNNFFRGQWKRLPEAYNRMQVYRLPHIPMDTVALHEKTWVLQRYFPSPDLLWNSPKLRFRFMVKNNDANVKQTVESVSSLSSSRVEEGSGGRGRESGGKAADERNDVVSFLGSSSYKSHSEAQKAYTHPAVVGAHDQGSRAQTRFQGGALSSSTTAPVQGKPFPSNGGATAATTTAAATATTQATTQATAATATTATSAVDDVHSSPPQKKKKWYNDGTSVAPPHDTAAGDPGGVWSVAVKNKETGQWSVVVNGDPSTTTNNNNHNNQQQQQWVDNNNVTTTTIITASSSSSSSRNDNDGSTQQQQKQQRGSGDIVGGTGSSSQGSRGGPSSSSSSSSSSSAAALLPRSTSGSASAGGVSNLRKKKKNKTKSTGTGSRGDEGNRDVLPANDGDSSDGSASSSSSSGSELGDTTTPQRHTTIQQLISAKMKQQQQQQLQQQQQQHSRANAAAARKEYFQKLVDRVNDGSNGVIPPSSSSSSTSFLSPPSAITSSLSSPSSFVSSSETTNSPRQQERKEEEAKFTTKSETAIHIARGKILKKSKSSSSNTKNSNKNTRASSSSSGSSSNKFTRNGDGTATDSAKSDTPNVKNINHHANSAVDVGSTTRLRGESS